MQLHCLPLHTFMLVNANTKLHSQKMMDDPSWKSLRTKIQPRMVRNIINWESKLLQLLVVWDSGPFSSIMLHLQRSSKELLGVCSCQQPTASKHWRNNNICRGCYLFTIVMSVCLSTGWLKKLSTNFMKFIGMVGWRTSNSWLDFGGDPDYNLRSV